MIFFLAFEVAFRILSVPKSNISFITTGAVSDELVYQKSNVCISEDENNRTSCYTFSDAKYFKKRGEFKIEKSSDVFRIITLGDSFTAGAGVENVEQTYPYQLERMLNENSKNLTYEVYNLGVGGFNVQQELTILEGIGLRYNPDLLILQDHPYHNKPKSIVYIDNHALLLPPERRDNSFVFIDKEVIPAILPLSPDTNRFILRHSYFMRFLSKRLDAIKQNFLAKYNPDEGYLEKISLGDAFRRVIEISKKNNIPLIIISAPGAFKGMCSNDSFLNSDVKEIAMQNNIYFIDLCDYIKDYDFLEVKSKIDCDICTHYNEKGYRIMAEALFENIKKLGFI